MRLRATQLAATLKPYNFETLKPSSVLPPFPSMRGRVVDDVQRSCYYQTVPRVKSGLPVYGSFVGCATRAGDGLR